MVIMTDQLYFPNIPKQSIQSKRSKKHIQAPDLETANWWFYLATVWVLSVIGKSSPNKISHSSLFLTQTLHGTSII